MSLMVKKLTWRSRLGTIVAVTGCYHLLSPIWHALPAQATSEALTRSGLQRPKTSPTGHAQPTMKTKLRLRITS